jgi:hypothetical protein
MKKKLQQVKGGFFNLILQTKDESVRAVCFSPEKQTELKTLEKVKSPVKIKNYQKPHQDIIFINKYTKITPLPIDEIDFPRTEICNEDGLIPNISSLQKVAGEQIVSLKGEVAELSGIKYLDTLHHGKLKKQEAIVRDTTSSTKVILWEDYVESLELNKTYLLKNLCVKVTKTDRYLNTAKTEKFTYTETEPFTHPLVDVAEDLSVMTSMTWTARILGIQQALKQPSCRSCGKTVLLTNMRMVFLANAHHAR